MVKNFSLPNRDHCIRQKNEKKHKKLPLTALLNLTRQQVLSAFNALLRKIFCTFSIAPLPYAMVLNK